MRRGQLTTVTISILILALLVSSGESIQLFPIPVDASDPAGRSAPTAADGSLKRYQYGAVGHGTTVKSKKLKTLKKRSPADDGVFPIQASAASFTCDGPAASQSNSPAHARRAPPSK